MRVLRQRMGADPAVVGRTMRINARDFTIVGIAPRGFAGPSGIISPAVWLPLGVHEAVRLAIGANRARVVVRQLLTEGLVLVAMGLGAGFVLAALMGLAVASLVYSVSENVAQLWPGIATGTV